jgi:hypothetical protein
MKLLFLSLIPLGCLSLAQLAQAQPDVGDPPVSNVSEDTKAASTGGRIEVLYTGTGHSDRARMGQCIPVHAGRKRLIGLFFSHPTQCYVYSDSKCQHRTKDKPFNYRPGFYRPAVSQGFGSCHTFGRWETMNTLPFLSVVFTNWEFSFEIKTPCMEATVMRWVVTRGWTSPDSCHFQTPTQQCFFSLTVFASRFSSHCKAPCPCLFTLPVYTNAIGCDAAIQTSS